MGPRKLRTVEVALAHSYDTINELVSLGEIVELDNGLYVNNGKDLQPLRGRDIGDCLQTYNGRFIWPLEPHADEIDVKSVARGLACEFRYGNQSPFPYPVAWHSVALSHVVPPRFAQAALIHDAAEAYLKDIPRPIKRQEPFRSIYEAIEERLLRVCCEFFGVDYALIDNEEFSHYDIKMSWAEMHLWKHENPVFAAKFACQVPADVEDSLDDDYIYWANRCPRPNSWKNGDSFSSQEVWQRCEHLWLERYNELFLCQQQN
jgi:hypothetical protein